MRTAGRFALFAALFFSTAAAAQEQPIYFSNTFWAMRPVAVAPIESEAVPRVARVNEFLFEQNIASAAEAIVQARVELPVPGSRFSPSPGAVTFEPGDALVLLVGAGSRAIFCDRRVSWQSRGLLGGRKIRACLVDDNTDGTFDRIMWAGSVEENFAPMFITALSADASVSVPYTLREEEEENPPLIVAGPVVTRSASGTLRMSFAVKSGDEPEVLEGPTRVGVRIPVSDAPVVVELMGARVEVISVNRDVVSYRILSRFDPAERLQIAFSGSMGLDTVAEPSDEPPAN